MRSKLTTGRAPTGKECAWADFRCGMADPVTVVSLEILTVLGAGLLRFYVINQLIGNVFRRQYQWIVILSTAKLYKG